MIRCWCNVNNFYLFTIWRWKKQNDYFIKTYTYLVDGRKIITRQLFKITKIEYFGKIKTFVAEEVNHAE